MTVRRQVMVPGGELETTLLGTLWARGRATARELYEEVGIPRGVVYTTITKVLDRLVDKGLVCRERAGRAYVYRAVARREATQRVMARRFLAQLTRGGIRPAMAALVAAAGDVSPQLLDELAVELRALRKSRTDGT